jgi:DNA-binding NarL/FixJ family response regulator
MELTRRELEIARMAAGGYPPRSIAEQMCLSVRTIESALLVIYTKLRITAPADLDAALRAHRDR